MHSRAYVLTARPSALLRVLSTLPMLIAYIIPIYALSDAVMEVATYSAVEATIIMILCPEKNSRREELNTPRRGNMLTRQRRRPPGSMRTCSPCCAYGGSW